VKFEKCWIVGRQVKKNAEEEVQHYINNDVDDILYFDDCAIFSLNAAVAFASVIHTIKRDSYSM